MEWKLFLTLAVAYALNARWGPIAVGGVAALMLLCGWWALIRKGESRSLKESVDAWRDRDARRS